MFSPDFTLSVLGFEGSYKLYELIIKTGKPKLVPKGKVIIRKDTPATFLFYIRKGVFKTVVKDTKRDFVLAFTFEDDIDCCPRALLNKLPNNFNIEAVTDCEVLVCDIKDLRKAAGNGEYMSIATNILNHYAGFLENQLIEFLTLTAEQRYLKLLEKQPEKIEQIPLSLLASYLGITQERLSRIRRKMRI
jgi:CRP-like cAMP-binding protein